MLLLTAAATPSEHVHPTWGLKIPVSVIRFRPWAPTSACGYDSPEHTAWVASRVMWKMKMAHSSGWETTNPSPGKATTGGTRRGQGYQEAEAGA